MESKKRPMLFYFLRTRDDILIVKLTDGEAELILRGGHELVDIPRKTLGEAQQYRQVLLGDLKQS